MTSPLFNRRHFNASLLALAGAGFAASVQAAREHKILVLGDSLSAEYGLPRGSGWVALLQKQLEQSHPGSTLVNASISGETTSGGRTRLPALLRQHQPSHVLIELGGNDALRGLSLAMTRENLQFMAQAARDAGAKVLLLGMQMPPNYGPELTRQFAAGADAIQIFDSWAGALTGADYEEFSLRYIRAVLERLPAGAPVPPEETPVRVTGVATANPQAPGGVEVTEAAVETLGDPAETPVVELWRPTLDASLPVMLDHVAAG